ncbi:RNA-binding transcriptional accessory protein [Marinomonas agarivorans]|nr:RNA-binding transcriptional accessory protein [Marinomonas agarivorans]
MANIVEQLATEFSISRQTVNNILALINEGASIPFIARYRKESTQGLSDVQLREFDHRQIYLRELEQRRSSILEQLIADNRLSSQLRQALQQAKTKKELEDIYAPFKKDKVSKVELARKLGLDKLANQAWRSWKNWDIQALENFVNNLQKQDKKTLDVTKTQELLLELFSEAILLQLNFIQTCKDYIYRNGSINSKVIRGKKEVGIKYQDYFDYSESLTKAPSHRLLALFRAKKEGILKLTVKTNLENNAFPPTLLKALNKLTIEYKIPYQLSTFQTIVLEHVWQNKLVPKIETLLLAELKENADIEATNVFANNLTDLLMAPPAGQKSILALDPGFRNGVKMAAIDQYGQHVGHGVIYPHPPQNNLAESEHRLLTLLKQHKIELIAIGNGTASRETETFVHTLLKEQKDAELMNIACIMVNESGASIYSASELAAKEFPDLDVTIRGAISIARRLQDPLAELIKIDPKSIGVGQYQHDIKPKQLEQALGNVVEDCVNRVGVDINLASSSLLSHISGLSAKLAENIVQFRQQHGGISDRKQLKKVKGIGEKCFEQCAGFLRINNGKHPLDASGVHPESYGIVEEMAQKINLPVSEVIANQAALHQIKALKPTFSNVDAYTFDDILTELAKPGRDPRPDFTYVNFDKSVTTISDLQVGMTLEGVATNIAAFGVFVDIGVHQDGLIHISQLADRFVKNPADIVSVGQIIQVEVLEVDEGRKRISLKALGL